MFHSIRWKILIPLAALMIFIAISGSWILFGHFNGLFYEELRLRTEVITESVGRAIEIPSKKHEQTRIVHAHGDTPDLNLIIVASGDPIKIETSTKYQLVDSSIDSLDTSLSRLIERALQQGHATSFFDTQRLQLGMAIPVKLRPLPGTLQYGQGVVAVVMNGQPRYTAYQRTTQLAISGLTMGLIFVSGLIYLLLHTVIIKRIACIQQVIELRTQGRTLARIDMSGHDEIAELSHRFDLMLDQVSAEQQRAEQAIEKLSHSETRLQLALDASEDSLWDCNLANQKTFFSENWCRMLGITHYATPTTIEQWYHSIFEPDRAQVKQAFIDHINGKSIKFGQEYRLKCTNGNIIWVLSRGKITDKKDRFIGTHSNITARKQAEALKEDFVSVVSHELRTPLTSIRGGLKLIIGKFSDDLNENVANLIDIAYRNSDRLLLLINDILDVQKLETGQMSFNTQSLDIIDLIKQTVYSNQSYGDEFGVEFVVKTSLEKYFVHGDSHRLSQVISNLLSNAAKFSSPGNQVIVHMHPEKDGICVAIQDFGEGIPYSFQSQVFKKFTQADASTTRKVAGTGLGLSIVKQIVEHHLGSIDFKSVPQEGSTFFVKFPTADRSLTLLSQHAESQSKTA